MPLPSGGGSAFFLLSLHARAACDESLRCSSVGSLRSPSRFHSDTCASSSAHTHTHAHTHTPRLSVCNHYNATVSSAHKVDRKNRSISTSSHRCWSITLKSYTMREPCQTMIIADFVFAMGLTKNLLLATFLKMFCFDKHFCTYCRKWIHSILRQKNLCELNSWQRQDKWKGQKYVKYYFLDFFVRLKKHSRIGR